jgi:hypothetical protein
MEIMRMGHKFELVAVGALTGLTTLDLFSSVGGPNLKGAAGFFGALPSPSAADALTVTVLWACIGAVVLWALITTVEAAQNHIVAIRRRSHEMAQLAVGGAGFVSMAICLLVSAHPQVAPGSMHVALMLVQGGH